MTCDAVSQLHMVEVTVGYFAFLGTCPNIGIAQ